MVSIRIKLGNVPNNINRIDTQVGLRSVSTVYEAAQEANTQYVRPGVPVETERLLRSGKVAYSSRGFIVGAVIRYDAVGPDRVGKQGMMHYALTQEVHYPTKRMPGARIHYLEKGVEEYGLVHGEYEKKIVKDLRPIFR